jgi:hypothetical protein
MIPKEKAKELVCKYYDLFSVQLENTISFYESKHCALTAVDEILETLSVKTQSDAELHNYWVEVKYQIENL